ncbi:O-antigen ligase family protein [Neolewinella aurantiaca]|uniref:O-antigen ligase family protein n=1 Tax=Neolewinella aurantiaca TaxID=2602767 RepID=A0A5C7FDN9_9BACT|nr:O-antigen ligase family protein [Neolewinella aurantiaca]TXF88797.1 O-antigen ligase family protein [Neolewinella aurantiaca]
MSGLSRENIETARYYLTLLMIAGAMFGLVFSPPFISVALISLFVLGLLDPLEGLNPRWKERLPATLRSLVFWGMAGLYLLLVAGIWQTEDWGYFTERLRIKVPLLALPLIWPGLPDMGKKETGWLFGGFALFMLTVLTGVIVNYGFHFEEVETMIRQGQPMPVPRNHIRFSLLVAIASLLSVGAYRLKAWGGRKFWLAVAALLFIGQHILAVRSGLAGAYGGVGVLVLALAWERGTWWPAVAGLIGLAALPVVAYVAVPSFRTKIQYARYELFHRDASKDTHEYSDEGRLTSIRLGLALWQDHFWLGVGPGNLRQEMDARYAAILPGTEGKRPHNQFVSALAGSGLIGGVFTLACFFLLARVGIRRRAPVYLAVWTVLFLSCQVENTLETSAGVTLFCLFLLLVSGLPYQPVSGHDGENATG